MLVNHIVFLVSADCGKPPLSNFLADHCPIEAGGFEIVDVDCRCRLVGATQVIRLRVFPILEPGPPARIRFTRQQELLEPAGPAKRIRALEHFQYRRRPELECPVAVGMEFGGQQAEIPAFIRNGEPLRQFPDQANAALLVPWVPGQILFRRRSFSKVVDEGSEAHVHIG